MKLHFKISLILLLSSHLIYSQGQSLNHRKYWWYKTRLNNDFVKVGLNAGESLPFNQRGADGIGLSNSNPNLLIGDGTSTLGYYIAVLATEYKLLKNNYQNTDKVVHELFCALNALDRVDFKGEYPDFNVNLLNGFFMRDDIPKNFITSSKSNYEHFNYYSNWDGTSTINAGDPNTFASDKGFHSKCDVGMFKVSSSWATRVDENDATGLYLESQDQVYDLLFGLAFVNKYVTSDVTDGTNSFPYSGETHIRAEARQEAKRLINYVKEPTDLNGNSCNPGGSQLIHGWRIKDPGCTYVSAGNDARAYAYALGESECLISNNPGSSIPNLANLLQIPIACPGSGYHDAYSLGAGFVVWNTIETTSLYNPNHPENGMDTRVFNTNLAAVCNCVYGRIEDQLVQQTITNLEQIPIFNFLGHVLGWIWKYVSTVINTIIPGNYTNITPSAITTNAYNLEAPIDHGPIAHALLHGFQVYQHNPQYSFDYLLDVAPCDGIYNFGNGNYAHYQWSSDNRCDHPNRRGTDPPVKGEFNGIDYLLYHNLYYLYQSGPFGINVNVTDLSDIYISQPTNLGCNNVNAYETITTENTNITCTSQTVWRAGKTIYFGSGTYITGNGSSTSGPNFHAYIQKFDCASDYGSYRMANPDSTNDGENSDLNTDSYALGAKYHTVNYPQEEAKAHEPELVRDNDNLVTELPPDEDPIESLMKASYPNYSKELFIKPTITADVVRAYFTMDDNETAFINVVDMNGKSIYNNTNVKRTDTGLSIDLSNFAAGTYILKFTSTKGTNRTEKIIKE